jgi:hypothetical protein
MQAVQEIRSAVEKLSFDELSKFRKWFNEFDAEIWDNRFEADVNAGKLDKLANQAIKAFNSGSYREV